MRIMFHTNLLHQYTLQLEGITNKIEDILIYPNYGESNI